MTDAMTSLETSRTDKPTRRIAIEQVSRVEGHGKVTLLLDDEGHVHQARLHRFLGRQRKHLGTQHRWLEIGNGLAHQQRLCANGGA